MSFSFNARYVLLTYAQCGDLCPFGIVDLLSSMGSECIIGREYHQDGEFTYIASRILGEDFEQEEPMLSMSEVTTRTLASLMALRERVTITQSKMGMWSQVAWNDLMEYRAEMELGRLIISGVRLQRQRVENRFGIWFMIWIQSLQSHASLNYKNTANGSTDTLLYPTDHQKELDFEEMMLMEEVLGCYSLELAVRELEESSR